MRFEDLDDFEVGYASAIVGWQGFWPEDDSEEFAKWQEVDSTSFGPLAIQRIHRDCATFRSLKVSGTSVADLLAQAQFHDYDEFNAGWDLWMSRQRCGVSYGDRNLDQIGEALDAAAEQLGETYVELGGDNCIHFGNE